MAAFQREVPRTVKEMVYACDATYRDGNFIKCCTGEVQTDSLPFNWSYISIASGKGGAVCPARSFHFCPDHANEVDSRAARILEP